MDNDAIKFIKLGFSIRVDELFFNLYIPSVCTSPRLDDMDVVCVFNLQVITWFQRMNHPVNSIAVLNLLLVCIAKWNAWQAIFIHNNDIIWWVQQGFNRWFPKLVHFKPVLKQLILNVYHKYDKLVAIHALIANHYLSFFLYLPVKVFSFKIDDSQWCITNF